jgi:superfamily II DNA or RNA helicase
LIRITKEDIEKIRAANLQRAKQGQQQQQQLARDAPATNNGNAGPSNAAPSPPPTRISIPQRHVPLTVRPDPIYTITSQPPNNPLPITGGTGYLEPHSLESDVGGLIHAERQRIINRQLVTRLQQLEAAVKNPEADPGMHYRSETPPLGAALLQLRMLRALNKQRELRAAIDAEGRELLTLTDKQYKMTRKSHRATLIDNARRDIAARAELAATRAKDVKELLSGGMKEVNQGVRDLRVVRNRGIMRAHERLARERNKLKEDDRSLRMAALKAHDFEAYQEMLRRQAGNTPAADERYEAISKFLADTEAYLNRLASKIASVKVTAEATSAAARAMAEARARGLSEDEVHAAAHAAAAEAATGNEALLASTEGATDAQSRYYALAHSNTEEILDQPRLLRPPNNAQLREYQIVGLQWMVSLYNNHLNGILADEMGLGKTVQVMALIAYLMDKKANYGPHLIIVPNAVMVNWKSELTQWLPSARCVYYVGGKEDRARKYVTEVQPLQFNVLVTTYEFIMRDRAKLSKIDWQYIVIDEAQRMKDRQSKLAKDLDRFTAARRLLLSGTPLQNDLIELWSLLNLLLPDVFDDKTIFEKWFGNDVGSGGGSSGNSADDWLAKEKRVVVIHRLHQILEPFMLRRQVEDVESKLPPKVAYTVRVPMSGHQSMVYTWVKTTGTLRLDPSAPVIGKVQREFASLNNKCMELRKLCNHPLLSYPPPHWGVGDMIVRQCGKLVTLDKMLVKLKASGHRVLLFSAMTKLLDLLEVYLQWRELPASAGGGHMGYLRIDGSTSLEDRETAIQKFNAPNSEAFVFLLSIRAAGRGLNLQSSDTVVIYDPDPNPKNEEQAIARSHRIGQTKEVRVFHLEAVTDVAPGSVAPPPAAAAAPVAVPAVVVTEKTESLPAGAAPAAGAPSSDVVKKEEGQEATAGAATTVKQENGGGAPATTTTPAPTAAAPPVVQEQPPHDPNRRLYGDSIESVMRNQIQRMKIEMANEVIDAGRFDQQTSMEERRHTLEALLQDQDRALQAVNSVPTNHELNKMLARGEDEMALFEKMDQEPGIWFDCTRPNEVPRWMQWRERDLRAALEENSKHKVDIEAEMAALTGTVLHHHVAPTPEGKAAAGAGAGGTAVKVAAAPEVKAAPAAPAAAAPPRAEPAVTTTTTRSLGREEEEEEDEVGMIDNDEEEEILEQNLVTDEANTEGGGNGNGNGAGAASGGGGNGGAVSGGNSGLQHIQSTAGMPRIPSVGTAAVPSNGEDSLKRTAAEVNNADGEGDGAAAGEPLTKKRRALSVHFEDVEEGKITQDGAVNVNDAGSILPPPPTTATAPAANPPPANGDDGKQ